MQKQRLIFTVLLLFTLACGLCIITFAEVPHYINYQGRLTDSNGVPLNGTYDITFRIYDKETYGNMLWEEVYAKDRPSGGIPIQKGVFNVALGSVTMLDLSFDKQYFLEIVVNNEKMGPRQQITSAAYAIKAERAEEVRGITNFFPSSGNVGIGTTQPLEKLDVSGAIAINGRRIIDSSGNWVGSPTGLVGPQGPQGPTGPQGPQGPPGPAVHTSAACGGNRSCSTTTSAREYCSGICNGSDKIVLAQCSPCSITSDTGSCNTSGTDTMCCVCKP